MIVKTLEQEDLVKSNTCIHFVEIVKETERAILFKLYNNEGVPAGIWLPKKVIANVHTGMQNFWVWNVFLGEMAAPAQVQLLELNIINSAEAIEGIRAYSKANLDRHVERGTGE